ncbi:MAG TPA: histidine ammonia-lyase [Chloroflexota bacterium]|nr:histidine ammonia-lyase [Chloroflexota bacterium]
MTVTLGLGSLSFHEVVEVARHDARVDVSPEACAAMQRSRDVVQAAAGEPDAVVYGVTTGLGALATKHISPEARVELQRALIRSHAAGSGPPLPREVVRAMVLLRAATLARAFSGVRPLVVERMLAMLNAGITPVVPTYGSLGASGDLAPLAHAALCLIGEGRVMLDAHEIDVAETPLQPLELQAKEGIALLNGTDGMLGMLVLASTDLRRLLHVADVACAMSVEALLGTDRPFAAELQALRPHPGQVASAANLRRLLAHSEIVASHRTSPHAVQDAYSLRCHPQVAGAARDTLDFACQVARRELGASIDNPAVLRDGRIESNGNFHGEVLAFACDFLAVASAEVGAIAERRVDRLLDPTRSQGLPAFLAPEPGVNSGLMLAQYTAAALVADNKRLAVPASVDSVPTSGMQEDHVSMGFGAALKLRQSLDNLARIIAVELVCAAHALELRSPLVPAPGTSAALRLVRSEIPGPGADRFVAPMLAAAEAMVRAGRVVTVVEDMVGVLQ